MEGSLSIAEAECNYIETEVIKRAFHSWPKWQWHATRNHMQIYCYKRQKYSNNITSTSMGRVSWNQKNSNWYIRQFKRERRFDAMKFWEMKQKANPFVKTEEQMKKCGYCCSSHPYKQCSAYGKTCRNCRKTNHFKVVCRINNGRTKFSQVECRLLILVCIWLM